MPCAVCIHLSTDKVDYRCVHCNRPIQRRLSAQMLDGWNAAIQWRRNCLPGVTIVMGIVRASIGVAALVAEPVAGAIHPLLAHLAHWGGGLALMMGMMSLVVPIESALILPIAQKITRYWHGRK